MKWALVATQTMDIQDPNFIPSDANPTRGMITISAGTIANIIVYDGIQDYVAPEGTQLQQVPDNAKIGDTGY